MAAACRRSSSVRTVWHCPFAESDLGGRFARAWNRQLDDRLVLFLGTLVITGGTTGFIAVSQIKKDPSKYTGKGLAIGGMVTGGVFLALYLLVMLIWGLAAIGGSLGR